MSTLLHLEIPRNLYDRMIAHALTAQPEECCGLLGGRIDQDEAGRTLRAVECYPLRNALASPVAFLSDPGSMFEAVRDMRRRGLEVVVVYHSHPTAPPIPSRRDLEQNYSPDVANVIIGLVGGVDVRAWQLGETEFREVEWSVVDEPGE